MNDHTLRVLEYDKVTNIVAEYSASEPGRAAILRLVPETDDSNVEGRLQETREFTGILQSGETPPLDGILDIGQVIQKLRVSGIILQPGELLNIATTLGAGRRIKQFFHRLEGRGTSITTRPVPLLAARAEIIRPQKAVEEAVFAAIDEKAEVRDSASPELRKIRKLIARMRSDILDRLSGILQDGNYQKVVQDPVITIRDDRYVLPLKPNFRQSLRGVVHGQSGSRATLFVEPLDVLEQNNRLAELRMEEREEVERILRELTSFVGREVDAIAGTLDALIGIDAVYARARFGIACNGTVPMVSRDRRIRLRDARHPLLVVKFKNGEGRKSVTPNDIELGAEKRALILSGPNAGGKTVVLKTVGLFSLMAQSGIPVTAAEGSELPCFGSVFADIGDEQSLEQDLSTFSSHVSQIAEILRSADDNSLVLLDELGSGTDPNEGAGLGAAVLDTLIERGCITLATTHHNALKLFGSQTNGAANAAMEFDSQTLKPTYRLVQGMPGRSYGLDMAARLGVPENIVLSARSRIGADDARLEKLLKELEENSRVLASEREALERERTAANRARTEAESLLGSAKEEARAVKIKVKAEAREVLASLRNRLRELSHAASLEQAEVKRNTSEIEALARQLEPAEERAASAFDKELHAGDRIRLVSAGKTGTVLGSHRGLLEIEVDGKKIRLSSKEVIPIEPVAREQRIARVPGWSAELNEEEGPSNRLNILGLRVEEGLAEVDRFIDRSAAAGLSSVIIIHGLGTGALKAAVTELLKHHPLIAVFRTGEPPEGGAGVTVAELKN